MVGARVAVLGAGMLGTAVALELAGRGFEVDLFDRGPVPITGAGYNNEGKLHLGFVYGNDASGRTVELVARGTVRFFGLLRRWIGDEVDRLPTSRSFLYAVPHDSLLTPQQVQIHAEAVMATVERLADEARAEGATAADLSRAVVSDLSVASLSNAELRRLFAPEHVAGAFAVPELGIDPRAVARPMRAAVERTPSIRFHGHTAVEQVDGDGHTLVVVTSTGGAPGVPGEANGRPHGPYRHVVNALWDGRLPVDLARGHSPSRRWLWRSKLSLRLPFALRSLDLPSVTYVLGPFGDMVDYGNGCSYLSWYPAGLLGLSDAPTPPPAWAHVGPDTRERITHETIEALRALTPGLQRLPPEAVATAEVIGGPIFAYGETDIDDPRSGLHQRSGPAVRSWDGYHSVDPGKFCLTPMFAVRVADRIAVSES